MRRLAAGLAESGLKLIDLFGALLTSIKSFLEWLFVDLMLGSGYAKIRPFLLFLLLLFGCAAFYQEAWRQSAFVPFNPAIYKDASIRERCVGQQVDLLYEVNWQACKQKPVELNPFHPLIYSLDQMMPFLQLGQKRDWQPVARTLNFKWPIAGYFQLPELTTSVVTWCQSIGSTLLYLFVVAILGGIIKRD